MAFLPNPMRRLWWLPLRFYRAWALWHIRRPRTWRYKGLRFHVPPGVFHPGVFFSTPVVLGRMAAVDLQGRTVLDVGTGSGAIALWAARLGAVVTAIDIHPLAVRTAQSNAEANALPVTVLQSDLFEALPLEAAFDWVFVNPPYFRRSPQTLSEHAFFAGENLEYFRRFFEGLSNRLRPNAQVWMILSEDCDWGTIQTLAVGAGFRADILFVHRSWGERLFIACFLP